MARCAAELDSPAPLGCQAREEGVLALFELLLQTASSDLQLGDLEDAYLAFVQARGGDTPRRAEADAEGAGAADGKG